MRDVRPPQSPHTIFVRWGRFQAGASGWPAVVAVVAIVAAAVYGRWLGMW